MNTKIFLIAKFMMDYVVYLGLQSVYKMTMHFKVIKKNKKQRQA